MKPLVSICIPNYNGEKYITHAIESALAQTYRKTEIIVVDNASTDGSWDIIKSFRKIKKFRHKANLGYNRNLNTCIELAKGKYVKILHSDDILEKDAVKMQVEAMESAPAAGLVYSPVKLIDENGDFIGNFSAGDAAPVVPGKQKLAELLNGNHIMFPSVMIRADCLRKVGLFDGEIPYCNDWDMWLRISMKYDIAYINSVSASYRVYSQSGGTVRYEVQDISGFQMYRCLTKTLSAISDESILKNGRRYYRNLAMEQISRGLSLIKRGKKSHGRRYILAASSINDGFVFRLSVYAIYLLTYAGMSGIILRLGKIK